MPAEEGYKRSCDGIKGEASKATTAFYGEDKRRRTDQAGGAFHRVRRKKKTNDASNSKRKVTMHKEP